MVWSQGRQCRHELIKLEEKGVNSVSLSVYYVYIHREQNINFVRANVSEQTNVLQQTRTSLDISL